MSEIQSKVIDIIVDKLSVEKEKCELTANFTTDLGADSLDTVELIMELEKVYGIQIPDEDAKGIQTVGDAVKYISEKVK